MSINRVPINDDFETILICAERYACGRESYMPSLVIDYITPLLPKLSDKTLNVLNADMKRKDEDDTNGFEFAQGIRHGAWGIDTVQKPLWMKFWEAVKDEIKSRD